MKSTSSSEPLIEVQDLNLALRLRLHHEASLRDVFVSTLQRPFETLMRSREVLHVLKNVSFFAHEGDRIAIIGRNGAGKSTLCRCLAGIYRPSSGVIKARGRVRALLEPSAMIYPELTGRENAKIMISLLYPELKHRASRLLSDALDFSGLGEFLDTPFRFYSTGMQTRLCLSIATCAPAEIFILDEVFEGADADFRERISRRILKIIEDSGVVLFVSHSEEQVRRICTKGLLLHLGEVCSYGGLDATYREYNQLGSQQLSFH